MPSSTIDEAGGSVRNINHLLQGEEHTGYHKDYWPFKSFGGMACGDVNPRLGVIILRLLCIGVCRQA
jgi:hypothetical protein